MVLLCVTFDVSRWCDKRGQIFKRKQFAPYMVLKIKNNLNGVLENILFNTRILNGVIGLNGVFLFCKKIKLNGVTRISP